MAFDNRLGGLTRKDSGRIGRAVERVEKMPLGQQKTSDTTPYKLTTAFARITANLGAGLYSAVEVLISVSEQGLYSWDTRKSGRIWTDNQQIPNWLNPLFNISLGDTLVVGDIVLVVRTNEQGVLTKKAQWCIISSAVVTEDYLETDKSCDWGTKEIEVRDEEGNLIEIIILPAIEFRNDVPRVTQVSRTCQRLNVGTVADCNCAYCGQEESNTSSNLGIERHYKFIWRKSTPTINYLLPETLFTIETSSGDANALGGQNELWIRFKHRFNGQTMEIDHGALTDSQLSGNEDLKHAYVNDDAERGIVYVYSDSAGTTLVPMQMDAKGHAPCIDGVCNDYDPPDEPTDSLLTVEDLDYPTSIGSLYNYESPQTTNITDGAGVDTNTFNKNNALTYNAFTSNGISIDIGFTKSINPSSIANATEYNGAGTGGNDDNIFLDYSKILDGSSVFLQCTLIETGAINTDSVTTSEVYLDSEFDSDPVPVDGTTFDVKTELTDQCDGNGVRQTRLDGLDEYEIKTYLYYKTDGFDINNEVGVIGGEPGYIIFESSVVDDQTTYSGASVSFNGLIFPAVREGSIIVARSYLEFVTANGVLNRQLGTCEICNNNNYVEIEGTLAGNTATHTVTPEPDDVGNIGTIEEFNGLKYFVFPDVADLFLFRYIIQKGGADTNEWSTNEDTSVLTISLNGNDVIFGADYQDDVDNNGLQFNREIDIVNTQAGPTDGWDYLLGYIQVPDTVEDVEDVIGLQYLVNVETPGIDPDATNPFEFVQEVPDGIKVGDNFSGIDKNSSEIFGVTWDTKYDEAPNSLAAMTSGNVEVPYSGGYKYYIHDGIYDGNNGHNQAVEFLTKSLLLPLGLSGGFQIGCDFQAYDAL